MPTIAFVTPDDLAQRDRRIERLEALLDAYLTNNEQWIPTDQALTKAGIKTRETLEKYARASRPGQQEKGRITWRKDGKKCQYLLASCIDYCQRKLGQPTSTD